MESSSSTTRDDVLSAVDPKLIHRVLLTDEACFGSLTVSGSATPATPSFDDFSASLSAASHDATTTMKRAYRDHVCDYVYSAQSMEPLHGLLLDLYGRVRKLVPSRKDLHGILKNDDVVKALFPSEMIPLVVATGRALEQLESEVRSETTREWIGKMESFDATNSAKTTISMVVTSIMYLILKAELCEADKKDFYLANVFAPMIHSKGSDYEKYLFETRYGPFNDDLTAPLTQTWIKELVTTQSRESRENLLVSSEARMNLIKYGWVDDILFRAAHQQSLNLPEVLANDDATINDIRHKTRMAAAGSALALHACTAAQVSTTVLNQPLESASPIALRRDALVEAMARKVSSIEVYEGGVVDAVVALAKEWNPMLSQSAGDTLQGRSHSVLRGKDPVLKLLDARMKESFRHFVTWKPENVPKELKSGIIGASSNMQKSEAARLFDDVAKKEFCRRGLSFYAAELADANYLSNKTIGLAWDTFGKVMLDKIIQNMVSEQL